MPSIFEIFGYPTNDNSTEATNNRRIAHCPFMGRECDGGGNRYSSNVTVKDNQALEAFFGNREKVCAGVCSIQLEESAAPWIVCPRRLLVLGREAAGTRTYQRKTEEQTLALLGYKPGTRLGVWPEVKIKYEEDVEGIRKTFDYTFDYVLMPLATVSQAQLEQITGKTWKSLSRFLRKGKYRINSSGADVFVENCPYGTPSIIEIMTSSTSGGNKDKGTTISKAFINAIEGKPHKGPGINYRQVWARMVSQLIVKSEVALGWNGKALWIVQDTLVDYISRSTALNVHKMASSQMSEVNMLSFAYNAASLPTQSVIELSDGKLFAGLIEAHMPEKLIAPSDSDKPTTTYSFQDITRAPLRPTLNRLIETLIQRELKNTVITP